MNKEQKIYIIDLLYALIMVLSSLFYVLADFSKTISNLLGLAQLIFSFAVIIFFLIINRSKKVGLHISIYMLYSAAQLIAVFNWFVYFNATFHIFPGVIAINWIGLAIHLLFIGWGLSMIIIKKCTCFKIG